MENGYVKIRERDLEHAGVFLNAWEDYLFCQKMDKKIVKRINDLIKDMKSTPFEGIIDL